MESHVTYIKPVEKDLNRPLWSVVIPTYNCANYLRYTLESVLSQDPGPEQMEIIVVDDCSTKDDPEAIIKKHGNGRVKFIRQKQNVGKVRNYESGLQASRGYLVHQLHGDDMVREGFYEIMAHIFERHPQVGAAFCRSIYIDAANKWTGLTGMLKQEDGVIENILDQLYVEQLIQTPSMVVKRNVYEKIGVFDRRLDCMEDREMWIRIANHYEIAHTNQVLAMYRRHDNNATNLTYLNGVALDTFQRVNDIVDSYVDAQVKARNSKRRKQKQADFWLLSYTYMRPRLNKKQRLQYMKFILSKYPSIKAFYQFIKAF
ncbi:glycosyltransferase family 2 protein [Winogradskyella aurantiaca]|uniref:glycosyltransferase family 2 protein n=1 Tax=Winogradskyella aurantiaca TaxID=2219558 RepID=UPI000E1CE33B|nr:glycosyltransferase [Winogradskyella aurantiaca]